MLVVQAAAGSTDLRWREVKSVRWVPLWSRDRRYHGPCAPLRCIRAHDWRAIVLRHGADALATITKPSWGACSQTLRTCTGWTSTGGCMGSGRVPQPPDPSPPCASGPSVTVVRGHVCNRGEAVRGGGGGRVRACKRWPNMVERQSSLSGCMRRIGMHSGW
jgi:hypothetical protein